MKISIILLLATFVIASARGQETPKSTLPYHEMPAAPERYSPGNVLARMIDGLGYRFYWATKGLRPEDLRYRPTEEARSMSETIDHILSLSTMIINAAEGTPNTKATGSVPEVPWSKKRERVLNNLLKASQLLADKDEAELADLRITFSREGTISEVAYWNMINGPIADAIYHTGQIVAFRRISGNPMNPKVDVFRGKNRP